MLTKLNLDQVVFLSLGVGILLSLLLAISYSLYWLWFTAFIGVHMIQVSFTGFCWVAKTLKKQGIKPGKLFE